MCICWNSARQNLKGGVILSRAVLLFEGARIAIFGSDCNLGLWTSNLANQQCNDVSKNCAAQSIFSANTHDCQVKRCAGVLQASQLRPQRLYGSSSSICAARRWIRSRLACKMGLRKRLVSGWMHNLHRSLCSFGWVLNLYEEAACVWCWMHNLHHANHIISTAFRTAFNILSKHQSCLSSSAGPAFSNHGNLEWPHFLSSGIFTIQFSSIWMFVCLDVC